MAHENGIVKVQRVEYLEDVGRVAIAGLAKATAQNILTASWQTVTVGYGHENHGELVVDLKALRASGS